MNESIESIESIISIRKMLTGNRTVNKIYTINDSLGLSNTYERASDDSKLYCKYFQENEKTTKYLKLREKLRETCEEIKKNPVEFKKIDILVIKRQDKIIIQ